MHVDFCPTYIVDVWFHMYVVGFISRLYSGCFDMILVEMIAGTHGDYQSIAF